MKLSDKAKDALNACADAIEAVEQLTAPNPYLSMTSGYEESRFAMASLASAFVGIWQKIIEDEEADEEEGGAGDAN